MQSASSPDTKRFENPTAERIRLRALYRDRILRGKIKLPLEAAMSLIGTDCAYHLYPFELQTRKP